MKNNTIKKFGDILMFFTMCFLTGTGLLMAYRLIPGSRGGEGLTLFSLSRHDWGDFHLYAAYVLIALAAIHLVLDFAFVKNVIASRKTSLLLLFALAGFLIILFFLAVPIERNRNDSRRHGQKFPEKRSTGTLDSRRSFAWQDPRRFSATPPAAAPTRNGKARSGA